MSKTKVKEGKINQNKLIVLMINKKKARGKSENVLQRLIVFQYIHIKL